MKKLRNEKGDKLLHHRTIPVEKYQRTVLSLHTSAEADNMLF